MIVLSVLVYPPVACITSRTKNAKEDQLEALVKNCEKDAGYALERSYNLSGSYLLLRPQEQRSSEKVVVGNNKFYLIHVKDSTMKFMEEIAGGSMSWLSEEEIEIYYPAGIPAEAKTRIYDVRSGTKRAGGKLR